LVEDKSMKYAVSRLAVAAAIPLLGLAPLDAAFAQTGPTPAQVSSAGPDSTAHPALWPHAASPAAMSDAATEAFVTELMSRMTLEEKVGQTIQADISTITPEDLATWPLGSILAGGSSGPWGDDKAPARKWVDLSRAFRAAAAARPGARIPLIYGIDAVHGHNNVPGATIFPHNIGLGAAA
jgi:beta-glucosidase